MTDDSFGTKAAKLALTSTFSFMAFIFLWVIAMVALIGANFLYEGATQFVRSLILISMNCFPAFLGLYIIWHWISRVASIIGRDVINLLTWIYRFLTEQYSLYDQKRRWKLKKEI